MALRSRTRRSIASQAAIGVLFGALFANGSALADSVADFYKGKQIRLIVGAGVGGVYDIYARLLSRHFGRYIPGNPSIMVQFMPGAGSAQASTYATQLAPQDGTVLLNPLNSLPLVKVLGQVNGSLDPAQFNWIGNMTADTGDVIVSTSSPVKTIEDAKRIEVKLGATSPLALGGFYPKLMNNVLGTKFKVVTGYVGTANVELAIERGEVEGQAGGTWFKGQGTDYEWYQAGKIRVLVQIGYKAADLPDVPLLTGLAKNTDDRRLLELFSSPFVIGKPTAVGAEVPRERVEALRAAYQAMTADPAFLADAEKAGATIVPTGGEALANLVERVMGLPNELVQRARVAVQQ